jgi:hypothetical protein
MATKDNNMELKTRAEKLAWCKARAARESWSTALGSMIQDMQLQGIPMDPMIMQLGMGEAMIGGEQGVRKFIDGIN